MYVLLVGSPILILTPEERLKSHQNHRKSFSYRVCIYMYLQINIFPLKVAIHKNMMLHLLKKIGKDNKKSIKVKNFYKLTQVKDIVCNAFKYIISSCVFFKDFSAETQLTLNQVHNQISCLFIFYSNLFEYIYKQKNTIIVNFHQMSARRNTLQ